MYINVRKSELAWGLIAVAEPNPAFFSKSQLVKGGQMLPS